MAKPVVALVGRPNVGKSTLFNRLAGERLAIVDNTPGTTRDRIFADAEWTGNSFTIVDTGGIDPSHGGKTPLSIGSSDFIEEIRNQARVAISEADVAKIVSQMQEGTDKPRHKVEFEVGEYIRVKEGPFTDFNGTVEEVNYERNKMRVSVTIFGRATPVELEFGQVEKT